MTDHLRLTLWTDGNGTAKLSGALGGVVSLLNINEVRVGLRALSAAALLLAALAMLCHRPVSSSRMGAALWTVGGQRFLRLTAGPAGKRMVGGLLCACAAK